MSNTNVVHVIDDDDAMRDSLAFTLRSASIDVRTYDSADTFLGASVSVRNGCILTDVRMPGTSGIDLLRQVVGRAMNMPVIVMTGHGDIQLAVTAMKIGAADFLEKPFSDEALLTAVRSALGDAEQTALRGAEQAEVDRRLASLSVRERQVLEGVVAGKPNKVVAFELGISPRTVEIYRAHVMTKMRAGSLSELVRMAVLAGVLPTTTA
jgi:two-component system response regulator FixJ